MLKLQFRDRRKEAVWLVDKSFTIGKSASNSLMIDDASVQEFHAEIIQKGDDIVLHDRSTKQTIKINGTPMKGRSPIKAGDVITLGTVELELVDPKSGTHKPNPASAAPAASKDGWALTCNASWMPKSHFPIKDKVVIGRDPGCDIHVAIDHLSRRHVELEIRSNQLVLKDLGSANGTFVNGNKVDEATLRPGDKIKLDVLTFEVHGPAHDPHKTIIRMAPASTSTPTQPSTTTAPAKPAAPVQAEVKVKASGNGNGGKKLVAEGRQEWLSTQSDKGTNKNRSRTGLILLVMSAVLAVIGTGILIAKYL